MKVVTGRVFYKKIEYLNYSKNIYRPWFGFLEKEYNFDKERISGFHKEAHRE